VSEERAHTSDIRQGPETKRWYIHGYAGNYATREQAVEGLCLIRRWQHEGRTFPGDIGAHAAKAIMGEKSRVQTYMEDTLIQSAARAFADFRGKSGNLEALARSRAVDLFGPDSDVESAAKRAAFKRLVRQYTGGVPPFAPDGMCPRHSLYPLKCVVCEVERRQSVDRSRCAQGHDAEMAAELRCSPEACGLRTKSTYLLDVRA